MSPHPAERRRPRPAYLTGYPGDRPEPVFVDGSGRRRRLLVAGMSAGILALLAAVAALVAGLTGAAPGHLPGLGPAQTAIPGRPQPAASPRPVAPAGNRGTGHPSGTATTPGPPAATVAVPSGSPTGHRNVPTQTPSHPKKK